MLSYFICLCLLTSFIGVLSERRMVELGSLVLLFPNVTADNANQEVSLFANGVEDPTLIVTYKIQNGYITMDWKTDNYTKILIDAKRNIWIANVDETYERKYYIQSFQRQEVELTILKNNYSATMRTALKDTAQKDDALPDRKSSEMGYGITSIALMATLMGMILVVIVVVVIVKKDCIFAWIQCKKKKSVPQPVQVTSTCDGPNSTSYQLVWNKPDDQYLLQKYILRYCEISSSTSENEEIWHLSPFLSVDDITPSTESYMLRPLLPGRYYQVEIQAVNTQGQTSSQSFKFKTKESVPQPVEVTSQHDSPDSTSYKLMWNTPDDGGSLLLKYNLRYREVEIILNGTKYELHRPLGPFLSVEDILPSAVSYTLSPLKPGGYYQVEIQAVNRQGQSSESFYFKTKECIPQPVQVTSHYDSPDSTSYQLMWDKPDDVGYLLQKYILQYREVEITPNGTQYELSRPLRPFISVDNILPSTVSYMLSSLTPGTYYQVEIQTIYNLGQLSTSFIFKTKESGTKQTDKEVQTNFQLPIQFAPCPTPTVVADETNSKIPRVSRRIEHLNPRKTAADVTDIMSISKDQQHKNQEWDKRPTESVAIPGSDSDDECNVALLDNQRSRIL